MKDHKITMLMILFFFIGLLVFFYPTLSNYYNEKNQSRTIYNYENILKNTNQIDFGKVKNDAIEYNKKLSKLKEPLLTYDTLKNYKKLLTFKTIWLSVIRHFPFVPFAIIKTLNKFPCFAMRTLTS